jgi:hypothetical protein
MSCPICLSPLLPQINEMIAEGRKAPEIQRWLEAGGHKVWHRNYLSLHKSKHCSAVFLATQKITEEETERVRTEVEKGQHKGPWGGKPKQHDLAVLVQERVIGRIKRGEVQPTVMEGLKAQELLDKREARQGANDDVRAIIFGLFRVEDSPRLPEPTIEAEYRDA